MCKQILTHEIMNVLFQMWVPHFHFFTCDLLRFDFFFLHGNQNLHMWKKIKNKNFKFVNWTWPKMWTVHIQNWFPFFTFEWQYPHVKAVIAHVDSNFHMWKQIMTHVNLLLHMWIPLFHTCENNRMKYWCHFMLTETFWIEVWSSAAGRY